LIDLNLFVDSIFSTMSRHLSFTLDCLYETVISIKKKMLQLSSNIYLKDIGEKMRWTYGNVLRRCVMVTNGSIYTLEKNVIVNSNFFYQENHPDKNS
jgi:hypothetical protein